jgi:putative endonuclease
MSRTWSFYIVRCIDNSLYCGITDNLTERLREHNDGTGAKYTSCRRPVSLISDEKFNNVYEAREREVQVNKWSRVKKERLTVGFPRLLPE